MSFFDKHEPDCVPIRPCRFCQVVKILRSGLRPGEVDEVAKLLSSLMSSTPTVPSEDLSEVLDVQLRTLPGMTTISANALNDHGLVTVRDMIHKTERELLKIKFVGKKGVEAIRIHLAKHNLKLGMYRR